MSTRIADRLAKKGGRTGKGQVSEVATRLRQQVIDRIDHNALAQFDEAAKRAHLQTAVERLLGQDAAQLSRAESQSVVQSVLDEILGLGPLEILLSDPEISDILVNGPEVIYIERRGRLERASVSFRDDAHLVNTISRIAAKIGRRVDESSPIVDARLPDGSRVNAIIPPLALDGAALSIRRFG